MGIDFTIPLAGMNRAETALNTTANRLSTVGATPQDDTLDVSAEMIALMEARTNFAVNAKVAQTQNQVAQSLVNLLG